MINNYAEAIKALRLHEDASTQEVKDSFRALSKIYHPDIYKLDNGEEFKRINQAYQYLKRYPKPDSVNYESSQSQYNYNSSYTYDREKEARREKARTEHWRRERNTDQLYQRFFKAVRLPINIILILNLVLVLDFFLPHKEWSAELVSFEKVFNERGAVEKIHLQFSNNKNIELSGSQKSQLQVGQSYAVSYSLLTNQRLSFTTVRSGEEFNVGYNNYSPFGFFIFFVLLACWRFYSASDRNTKMNAVVGALFLGPIQLYILLS